MSSMQGTQWWEVAARSTQVDVFQVGLATSPTQVAGWWWWPCCCTDGDGRRHRWCIKRHPIHGLTLVSCLANPSSAGSNPTLTEVVVNGAWCGNDGHVNRHGSAALVMVISVGMYLWVPVLWSR